MQQRRYIKAISGRTSQENKEEDIILEIKKTHSIRINRGTKLQIIEHLEKFILINLKMYEMYVKCKNIGKYYFHGLKKNGMT